MFENYLLWISVSMGIVGVLYSWKEPLILIPLFFLFTNGLFGQIDLTEKFVLQVMPGLRINLADSVIILMLFHLFRPRIGISTVLPPHYAGYHFLPPPKAPKSYAQKSRFQAPHLRADIPSREVSHRYTVPSGQAEVDNTVHMRDELFNPKKKKKELLFSGPIIFFSYYLVINVLLKILFYEASAGEKITPLIRLFGSFTVYFLLVKYLTKENIEGFVNFCYLLAILSVIFFFGYFFFLIPLPRQFSTLSLEEKIVALRTGLPNSFFLLFPFYFALSTLVFRSGRFPRKRDILIIVLIAVAGLLSTFRMYSFILLFGLLEAWMISSVHIRKKILWIVTTGLILFILVQVLMYFEKGSFLNVVLERVSGTNNELHSEQSSGGGRIIRNLAALPYFFDISLLLLGSMFTSQANVFSQFITGDLGILATYLLYGVFGIWLIVIIFKRGLPASWNARSVGGYDGKIAMMFFLFLIAIGPSVIFMYDPLGSENWIATWSIFLGTFDALRAHSG